MGLDMNLYRRVRDVGQLRDNIKKTKEVGDVLDKGHFDHHQSVIYWRKFNALHKYFADHFNEQDSNEQDSDNCVDMYMSIDDIKELLALMVKIRNAIKVGETWVHYQEDYLDKTDELVAKGVGAILEENKKERKIISYISPSVSGKITVETQHRSQGILNPEVCEELPTEDGFFFGTTDYGEYYIECLDYSIKEFEKLIKDHKRLTKVVGEQDIDYYYRAWY